MKNFNIIVAVVTIILSLALPAFSQPVKPHTFSPADPVSSSKINANFDTIYQWGSVASAAIELHKADTAAHGANGAVVGTTNTQTLTNKTIGTGSIWNGSAISDAYLNTAYSNAAMSGHRNSIRSADTRSTNYEPDDRDMGLYADFKGNSTDGLSDGATFHGVLTFRPYGLTTDMSGGFPFQLGFTENTNVWLRKGTSTTAWSSWYKLFHSGHTIPDGNIDSAICRDSELTTHAGTTTGVHGVGAGAVVGTTLTQTLTNKSISGEQINSGTVADARIDSALARDSEVTSAVSTHAGLTATHGATGAVMGTTNTQTVTNKTLDSTNSVDGGAIKSGTVADARIASTLARWGATGADANAVTNSGFFHASANIPTTDGESDKALIHNQYGGGSTWATQIAQSWRNGRAWIRNKENGTWEPWHEIWTTNNDGSDSGLDADLLDGYHVSTTAGAANSIPVRDANGYLYLGWINTTSGDRGTTAPTRIYASNDSFLRYYTPANFKTVMGLNYGTAAGTVCEGNDSRLSDARTPVAHVHSEYRKHIKNNITTAGAGWYRVARLNGSAGRGNCEVSIYTTGGSYVPQTLKISCYHDWSVNAQLEVTAEGASYWSGVRITDDGSYAYVEVNFTSAFNSYAYGLDPFGYDSGYTIYSGALSAGGGTVRTSVGTPGAGIFCSSTFPLSTAANSVALRDSSGDITTRLFRSTYAEQTTAPATTADIAFRNDTSDNYIRFMDAAAFKAWLINSKIGVVQTSAPASPVDGDIWVE